MRLEELRDYVLGKGEELVKVDVTLEASKETVDRNIYVTKTKEAYEFTDEGAALAKINEARQNEGFKSVRKQVREAKVDKKTGDELKPETYLITVELLH